MSTVAINQVRDFRIILRSGTCMIIWYVAERKTHLKPEKETKRRETKEYFNLKIRSGHKRYWEKNCSAL